MSLKKINTGARLSPVNQHVERLFSFWMLILCLSGLAINLIFSKLVIFLGLPLYIDNVGSILVGALGGPLPGIITGFLSNILNSLENPISLYYGILTVAIAWMAALFSQKDMFKKLSGWFVASMCFVVIGGAVGSVMTWLLYGGEISGIGAPFALFLNSCGLPAFYCQLAADVLIDIPDKMITVAIVCLALHFYPKALYDKFPYSGIYEKKENSDRTVENNSDVTDEKRYGHSVNSRLTTIVVASVAVVGICSLVIGIFYYQQLLVNNSRSTSQYVSSQAAMCVDGDAVLRQFEEGQLSAGYKETKEKLTQVFENTKDIRYVYVYVMREDGCYVLYDVDTPEAKGASVGAYVERDLDIYNRYDEFLAGGPIEPGYGNNPYGTMISAYTPVYNSQGETVAYACADINLSTYVQKMLVYAIQFASIIFTVVIVTLLFMIWYVNHHITEPIRSIVDQTKALNQLSPELWMTSKEWAERVPVETDDELEEVYMTVTNAEKNASINVMKRMETEQKLIQTEALKKMNEELAEMIKKADEANQAKTDFLARMSHDMRTPMNAIIGLSALTLDDADKPEVVRENMAKVRASSDFLLGLVNDILDLVKIEEGSVVLNMEPYTYNEFLSNMRTMFLPQCEAKNLKVSFKNNQLNPMVRADKMRLNQIFFNIFSNAVKYTPPGGSIDYYVENLSITGDRLHAEAVIKDSGIGMSKAYQSHLFEPFVQESSEVTPELQGSGLGLSITKQLVELMGGTIRIDSEKGKGTKVTIAMDFECLARDVKPCAIEKKAPFDEKDVVLAGRHVLLVEDHPLNAQIARKLLEKKQMYVTHAVNGKIGVSIFQTSTEHYFDLILMDIRMPEMSGLEAASAIRAMNRADAASVPIIAMSANAYAEDVQKSMDAGMNAHLAKPVDPPKLYQTICDALRQG